MTEKKSFVEIISEPKVMTTITYGIAAIAAIGTAVVWGVLFKNYPY